MVGLDIGSSAVKAVELKPAGKAFRVAAFGMTQRLQQFVMLGQMGVGQAAGVLVGQNLGAKKLDRARATTWWALGQCFLMSEIGRAHV